MIGTTVSHYKITEKLGEGGMAEVYLADDLKLERQVAIKFLPSRITIKESFKTRFLQEAQAAAAINHPNVCVIHEIQDQEEHPFIVMEYLEGQTLESKINGQRLPINEIITISKQIAIGLIKAHEQGVIHRDIKPSNIIITKDGVVKILDFGLAKLKGELHAADEESIIGTTRYMSPEQCFSDKVDQRTDIWSLGVVIYEMLMGQLPFQANYDQSVAYAILKKDHEPISSICHEVPENLEQMVDKCLQKDPDQRYQNVGEMLDDLRYLEKEVIQGAESDKQRSSKRSNWFTFAALILILVIAGGYIFYPRSLDIERRKTIAVLPFKNLSADSDNEYFSDGITEDIRVQLTKISDFKVLSRTSVMKYKQEQMNLAEIAKKLNATAVLEGSVRRSADHVRIIAQLFETGTEECLWAEIYDQNMTDIFDIQINIAGKIAGALKTELTSAEKARLKKIPTIDISAYDYYLRGRNYIYRYTRQDNEYALELFKKAIKLDPQYALAYTGLADAYAFRGEKVRSYPRAWLDSAITICNKAITLNPNTSEAYRVMGRAFRTKGWYQKSLNAFYQAIELNSSNWEALRYIGTMYRNIGKYEESLIWYNKVLQISPLEISIYNSIGKTYLYLKDFDKSIYWYKRAMELKPESSPLNLAVVYMEQGKSELTIEILEGMIQSDSTNEYVYHETAIIYQNYGMTQKAIPLLKKALKINPHNGWHYMALAGIYVEQGKLDNALALYQQGMKLVPQYLAMSLTYSFLLSRAGRRHEARTVATGISIPKDHWKESLVHFYLGLLTEPEMEEALKDAFVEVGGKKEIPPPHRSYFLGMAYLHNLDDQWHNSPRYIAKAIECLNIYHLRGDKTGVENAIVRAELRKLSVLKN